MTAAAIPAVLGALAVGLAWAAVLVDDMARLRERRRYLRALRCTAHQDRRGLRSTG